MARFDRITSRHDHAICSKCGKLADMETELPEEIAGEEIFQSSNLESLELTLRGLQNKFIRLQLITNKFI